LSARAAPNTVGGKWLPGATCGSCCRHSLAATREPLICKRACWLGGEIIIVIITIIIIREMPPAKGQQWPPAGCRSSKTMGDLGPGSAE